MSTPILPEQPPYNEDAEESVLGAALMDPAALAGIRDSLSPQDFHDERRSTIFRAMLKIDRVDFVTLTDALEMPEWNDYVASLLSVVPTSINAEYYAAIVKRDSLRRKGLSSEKRVMWSGLSLKIRLWWG